ncbi:MAG: TlyA family RNA methyltransferase [Desulfobacterota bacterium]|nr:TlyA family RNA methyltransferase [Thermodesulfobacteriota bacterium]
MARKHRERLDNLLVRRGVAISLHEARALIMAGNIVVGDHRIDKPGTLVPPDADIRIKHPAAPYVGRGGMKLALPLAIFQVPVAGKVVLDVGASQGGFTDCLLQHGARRVYAVDVGYGQLAWKLQHDPRVVRYDRTDIRDITPQDLDPQPELAVIDVSFTSLSRVLPHVITLLVQPAQVLCLMKPQFEVPRHAVPAGGIVRDRARYQEVQHRIVALMHSLNMMVGGIVESPVPGKKGNREFFIYAYTHGGL